MSRTHAGCRALIGTVAIIMSSQHAAAQRPDYARAEQLLDWNVKKQVFGTDVAPTWMKDSTRFWYRVTTPRGPEFYMVDPALNTKRPVFDNGKLAAAMTVATDTTWEPSKLPVTTFKFTDDREQTIEFSRGKRRFTCDIAAYRCTVGDTVSDPERAAVKSPDGKWLAFAKGYNLFLRSAAGNDTIQLTTDGEDRFAYGIANAEGGRQAAARPSVEWSPDSKKLIVERRDLRGVKDLWVMSSTSTRPTLRTYRYAMPGDSAAPHGHAYVIDIASKAIVPLRLASGDTLLPRAIGFDSSWIQGSEKFVTVMRRRGERRVTLFEVDATTGVGRPVVSDSSGSVSFKMLKNGEILVSSQRDGWAHVYLFAPNGTLKTQITSGEFAVAGTRGAYVDEKTRRMYLTANGREPNRNIYHNYLYRVGLDGGPMTLLTPEDGDHKISFSPNGKYFVDTYSRLDLPPITVVRSMVDGRVIRELERADASRLADLGWTAPELFRATAADGVTDVYGFIFKPSFFDSTKRYPVIDQIYPVPTGAIRSWGFNTGDYMQPRAMAELGFIVVQLQPRGTSGRSRAFLDAYQGRMGQNTLPDHVTVIQQLAARHRWIDVSRVGIYGLSGGGFASTAGILRYPDFFKACVSLAGNHDNRTYGYYWGEDFQGMLTRDPKTGIDNYEAEANSTLAKNLKGKLLLMHGDMDDNVHPAHTLRLVHALIAAKKDFDMLILPDRGHSVYEPYAIKKSWDHFVRYLMGVEPPEYVMADQQ